MTFGQFLSALRARWMIALAVLVLIVGATAMASLLWPKRYSASASVVVDAKPDPVSSLLYPGLGSPAFMATQVDILNSERVAQRVVRNLKLAENPQVRQQWTDATQGRVGIESWLGDTFQRSVEVKPSRESNVITVTYKAPDPKFAAALANAFVQAYIDVTLDMRVNPAKDYSSFFETRAKEARDAFEAAQTRLSTFQREKGIIASDERLDIENSRLNELSSQLTTLQAISAESASRQRQAQGTQADRMQEVLNNSLVSGIKSDLSRGEARLQELSTRYGDNHPQVQETKANVAELRSRLEAETRKVTGSVGLSNTINRQRESEIRGSLDAQRTKVLRFKAIRDEGLVIIRDVENAQRAYDAVQARLTQTSLESQTKQSNVYLLNEASVPLDPASPRIALNLMLSLFVGTMLAVATALAVEVLDRHVRGPQDLVAASGVPVLVVLPNGKKRLGSARKLGALAQQRVVGQLTGPATAAGTAARGA
jgi:polysaccharide biosynthesis transport protein